MTEHRIPAIDRAVDLLDVLANFSPASIKEICDRGKLARSTVYRTLNTLEAHNLVRREEGGGYVLGPRLLKLARSVPQGSDIVSIGRPVLERLAASLGSAAKLSIVDGAEALVVAVAESPGAYSITTQVGRRFPLHAGAASKLLLAYLPEARRTGILGSRLSQITPRTVTDPAVLSAMLTQIRMNGFAEDSGEYVEGVRAFAAPVTDSFGACIAAVSVPFVETADPTRADTIGQAVIKAAKELSTAAGA
jgi:DNA-binding IclR family transcriptional regulator